ncbi:4Fe-4S binding protein [Clostridium sp.]|uniref:4Fe-4S binding protein n=1 Tax=Clostridium sp. TaxID=1506 RepID=UPI002FC68C0E
MEKKKRKSHQSWSWILMVAFLILSILDYRFGILGAVCMGAPLYHAIRGRGKIHCSMYCPRGSILGKFLKNVSLNNNFPNAAKSNLVKNLLLGTMVILLTVALYHANRHGFNFLNTSFALFRFMTISLLVGTIIGIIFKPRSWCQVCPMGHGTALIDKAIKSKNSTVKKSGANKGANVNEIKNEKIAG